jgi:hypothetical protein
MFHHQVVICGQANCLSRTGRWLDLQSVDKSIVTIQDNLIEIAPCFVDRDNMDFQLKDNSPAYEMGFKRIPMEEIGPIRNSSSRSEACP